MSDIKFKLVKRIGGKRVALVGIGNIEKGDDGFGVRLIQQLKAKLKDRALFECGVAPENYLGPIVKSNPQALLIVDAANLDAEPGHIHIVEEEDIASIGLSTHDTSLKLFITYLKNNLKDLDIFLLGIQPKDTNLGGGMSEELRDCLARLEELFLEILG